MTRDDTLPSGTVTFLYTDIEGSTPLWERDPQGMKDALERHNLIIQRGIEAHNGRVFKVVGDAFQAAFADSNDAILAAVEVQRALANEKWGSIGPLKVRMGIHVGLVQVQGRDYAPNHTLNRVARIMSAGHGGQILLSLAVAELARGHLPAEVGLLDLGEHHLKGLNRPEHLLQVVVPELQAEFPPLMSEDLIRNRYQIVEQIGQGGMGVVYRGHDTLLDRDVAIKVLGETRLGSEGRARLLREAQAIARLNHPNIVTVYDAGEWEKTPYIVMELVAGTPLSTGEARDIPEILSIARQVCAALEQAHLQGIIHRDLKPENVMVTPDGQAKLMDFGLARSTAASRLTVEGGLVGTVFYLAPEQALGQELDGRTDLYALGVLLYELAAGRLPFQGDDPLEIISQHIHAPVIPPSTHNIKIPPALDHLIIQLLRKDPAERPASAGEVLRLLKGMEAVDLAPLGVAEQPLINRLVRGRLVGRSKELLEARAIWERVSAGEGQGLLVSGEPGIGKTRLANELIAYARLHGAQVLQGGCYEYEAVTPYLPLAEALRDWVHAQPLSALQALDPQTAVELARLAPEIEARLGPLEPNPPLSADQERLRLFDHLARFLQSLCAKGSLVLFIDDLHWADPGTIAFLHYLLRRLRNERLMFLGAYRELELDRAHPLSSALVAWNRERLVTRLHLGRLGLEDCAALLAAMFGQQEVTPEFAQAIYHETEGNPFFIEEVIKALIDQGQIYRQGSEWERSDVAELAIPQSIKEAIGRRLDRLNQETVEVLRVAAVLGKNFSFRELAAGHPSDGQEDRLLDALDEALSVQLLQAGKDETFVFTHDKIREVLYEELNPVRRRRYHQRLAEGLEGLYSGEQLEEHIQDLAYHFLQSGDLERALEYSLRAAEHARRLYASDEALSYYQYAAESAAAMNLTAQLAKIYEAMGDIQLENGPFYKAVESYQQAIELVPSREKQAALKTRAGAAYTQVGDPRGLEYLRAAQADLDEQTQPDELAQNLAMQGRFYHYHAQHTQAIAMFERALQLAEPHGRPETLVYIYSYLAGAYQHLARFDESIHWAEKCIELGGREDYPFAMAVGYEFLSEDSVLLGRWEEALDSAEQDRQIGEKIGSQDRLAWSYFCKASALHGLGNLNSAREVALSGLALAKQNGEKRLEVWVRCLLGYIETDLGILDSDASAIRAVKQADELGELVLQCNARSAYANLLIQIQELDRAFDLYEQCVELFKTAENRLAPIFTGPVALQVHLRKGWVERALQFAEPYLQLVREAKMESAEGVALRHQGEAFAMLELWEQAKESLNAAVLKLEALGSRLEFGRALYQRAGLYRALGDAEQASSDIDMARSVFEECGARLDLERMEKFSPALGQRSRA